MKMVFEIEDFSPSGRAKFIALYREAAPDRADEIVDDGRIRWPSPVFESDNDILEAQGFKVHFDAVLKERFFAEQAAGET
jgi:hypothetical protein